LDEFANRPDMIRHPAMQCNVTNHVWSIGELVEAPLNGVVPDLQGHKVGRFTVVDGGKE
jgi:hypothetical protein